MLRYLLSCLRLLGMYYEQAGMAAYQCVLMLGLSLAVAIFISLPFGLSILSVTILYVPWRAWDRTKEATSQVPGVQLPRNQAVTTLYFPGLGNDSMQMQRYTENSGFPGALDLLINPMCIHPYDAHDFTRFNVAQSGDVDHALEQVLAIMADKPHDRFIFFGTSRGAAVALEVTHLLEKEAIERVAFTVCEGVFDTTFAIMQARFNGPVLQMLHWILPKVTEYQTVPSFSPLKTADIFNHPEHPVLCVSSRADEVVPLEHTKRVYMALQKRAPKAELLILEESPHSSYATWKDVDRLRYVHRMQEWVNKYV